MKSRFILFVPVFLFFVLFGSRFTLVSAGSTDCTSFENSAGIPVETSTTVTFNCAAETAVYFGACDDGGVPNDDLFNMVYEGNVVTYNYYVNGVDEYTVLGSATAKVGTNTVELNSLNTTPYPPATYAYAISPNSGDVVNHLQTWCGADWVGIGSGGGAGASCDTNVPLFTNDTAPSNGTIELHVLFGNEGSFDDEIRFQTWDVTEGEQINNAYAPNLPAPRYLRAWWQPEGSSDWYLMTSQYWQGGGTLQSEYGLTCNVSPQPSYHTSFVGAIPEADVCFDLLNGCN